MGKLAKSLKKGLVGLGEKLVKGGAGLGKSLVEPQPKGRRGKKQMSLSARLERDLNMFAGFDEPRRPRKRTRKTKRRKKR